MDLQPKETNFQNIKSLLTTTFFILGILISISFFGMLRVEEEIKSNLSGQLKSTLNSNLETLRFWYREKKSDAKIIAANPELKEKILSIEKKSINIQDRKELIKMSEHIWIRDFLGMVSKQYGFVGFVLFDQQGRQIGSLLDEPVGQSTLKEKSDFFRRSLEGQTIVSLPFEGEVDLPDVHGVLHKKWPTMFVSTPVKDEKGKVFAVLSFRIRPETEFSKILHITQVGKTGETYAFSSDGTLLTSSRFNEQLKKIGLISTDPWSQSILNIKIADPLVNLTHGKKSPIPKNKWSLTKMAASATLGGSDVSTTPYNDYRGVPVIGTWTWMHEQNLGIASEIDANEALKPVYNLRKSFYAFLVVLCATAFLLIFFRSKQIIAERKQKQKELSHLDEQLKNQIILDNVVDAIITIDKHGIIQTFNQGAKSLFQYDEKEVLGQNIKMLMPDPDHSQHDDYLKRFLSTKVPQIIGMSREVTGLKKDGTEFPIDLAVSQVSLHDRIIFAGVIRDISQRKEFEAALIEAKNLSDEANQSKSNFLANMSHEIRTPMNGIIGLTQLALKTEMSPVQIDYLNKIDSSSQNLLTIINDILDVSKIEAGKLTIENTEFYLEKVLQGVSDVLLTKIHEKRLEFHFDIADDVPKWLLGDPVRLSQILTNLTSNAVKFTERGHIIISIRVLEKSEEFVNIEFSVKDSGIGLTEEEIEKLFIPFNQADTSTSRKFGGTGLGLTIVKKLVLMMGGDIHIESQSGIGSNFIFNIALKPLQKKEPVQTPKPHIKGTRILVIDDSPFMRDILLAMLRSLDFEATVTSRYADGLLKLNTAMQEHPYDLVIIDNKLPDAIGAEVCSEIKNINPEKETKTILISGFAEEIILRDIKVAEFDGFLHKPITRSSLLNMIQHVLSVQEAKETIASKLYQPINSETEDQISIQGGRVLLVEDNKINQQIACEFLRNSGLIVSVVENGQEALDALKHDEYDTVLMDIQMPVMDGYRATREIRALPQFNDLPIIAMTANANMEDREKALACGMNEHIPKPVDRIELIKTLTRFISAKPILQPSQNTSIRVSDFLSANVVEHSLSPIRGLDLEEGLRRVGYNEELYKSLLTQFIANKSEFMEKIESAIQEKEMEIAAKLLHSLKGVTGNIGAKDLTAKIIQIEEKLRDNKLDSEFYSILDSAKQSMETLTAGIVLLGGKYSSTRDIEISLPLPEYENLAPMLEVLKNLILDSNLKSRDYINTIEETFSGTPIKEFLRPVNNHLTQFNFSKASETLKDLENQLQTSSTQN
jgi:PAS domain S-box-containing protein